MQVQSVTPQRSRLCFCMDNHCQTKIIIFLTRAMLKKRCVQRNSIENYMILYPKNPKFKLNFRLCPELFLHFPIFLVGSSTSLVLPLKKECRFIQTPKPQWSRILIMYIHPALIILLTLITGYVTWDTK